MKNNPENQLANNDQDNPNAQEWTTDADINNENKATAEAADDKANKDVDKESVLRNLRRVGVGIVAVMALSAPAALSAGQVYAKYGNDPTDAQIDNSYSSNYGPRGFRNHKETPIDAIMKGIMKSINSDN